MTDTEQKTPTLPPRGASRREILVAGAGLAALAASPAAAEASGAEKADFLFVQTAGAMAFDSDQNRLTLRGISPVTLFFSDRPERIAGNMKTDRFVPFWSEGPDSFASSPPNADLSVLENGALIEAVVELREPVLLNGDLQYTVKVLSGQMPVLGDNASLFIDIIGMPLTPVSFAGVARRTRRRAFIR